MELSLIVVLSSRLAEFVDACYDAVNFAAGQIESGLRDRESTPKIQHDKEACCLRSSIQLPIDTVPDAIVDSSLLVIPSFCPFRTLSREDLCGRCRFQFQVATPVLPGLPQTQLEVSQLGLR